VTAIGVGLSSTRIDADALGTYLGSLEILEAAADRAECTGVIRDDFRGFDGHFPDNPLLAGAFQLEILFVLARTVVPAGWVLGEVEHARFRRMVRPGDRVRAETWRVISQRADGCAAVRAILLVGTGRACQATLLYSPPR
jgi:3-hydroxymyristoyl/3-hydroxydecanoyl-(acyl carrier protein) dehydratase